MKTIVRYTRTDFKFLVKKTQNSKFQGCHLALDLATLLNSSYLYNHFTIWTTTPSSSSCIIRSRIYFLIQNKNQNCRWQKKLNFLCVKKVLFFILLSKFTSTITQYSSLIVEKLVYDLPQWYNNNIILQTFLIRGS